ncbi:piggyBac transposable element-derived protein 4-like [Venturia canescens]|uniref:piggyBac transposable element-derived protein 4-like n=1 Tax=Venturia canescens TaxID=32260 RepID=UPI001C9BC642|nr:piggyBac transposable element-derived protein 4-like [Venturia canescens]
MKRTTRKLGAIGRTIPMILNRMFVRRKIKRLRQKKTKCGKTATFDGGSSKRGRRPSIVRGKDGHQWFNTPRQRSRGRSNTPTSFLPGPIGAAKQLKTPVEFWSLLFPDSLIEKIVVHTNEEIRRYRDALEIDENRDRTYSTIDIVEIKAYFGLLYFSGMQKTSHTNTEDLWNPMYGSIMYRSTMSRNRFWFISKNLRFDDKTTRGERRETDKFAPIREVWEQFLSNCKLNYNPASYVTIDEQLVSFRGRCPFKVYNGSKPDKYGIKILMLNDARTFYMFNAEPYAGKVIVAGTESVPSYYIQKLSETLHGSKRNITCDNWFASVPIFKKMLSEHLITMVGTLRKNKREIPEDFKRPGSVQSSKFAFDGQMTLVAHTPKKNKVEILLSTLHENDAINPETKKPEIIHFYNTTKGGTDSFDQLCHEYTTARKTLRWPMRIWMAMLDQGGINAMILHNFNAAIILKKRKDFLKELIQALVEPHMRLRLKIPTLCRELRLNIQTILHEEDLPVRQVNKKQGRCALCPRSKDRKSQTYCTKCGRAICEEHKIKLCVDCVAVD